MCVSEGGLTLGSTRTSPAFYPALSLHLSSLASLIAMWKIDSPHKSGVLPQMGLHGLFPSGSLEMSYAVGFLPEYVEAPLPAFAKRLGAGGVRLASFVGLFVNAS